MFKVLIALSLFLAIQGGLIGGFTNRCDLVESSETSKMINLAVAHLAQSENLQIAPADVVGVATQLVDGLNFRIVFTAHDSSSNNALLCAAIIYQTFAGAQSVSAARCA